MNRRKKGLGGRPLVSVILATHDHSDIDKTLEALVSQTAVTDMEIIGVDSLHIVRWPNIKNLMPSIPKKPKIRLIEIEKGGRSRCWNTGVRLAKADLLLFLADDFIAIPTLVEEHLAAHRQNPDENVVAIGPAVYTPSLRITPFMRWLEESGKLFGLAFSKNVEVPPDFFWGANASLKKSFFAKAGGYDEDFPHHGWDDYELGLRLKANGMRKIFLRDALSYHEHPLTLLERKIIEEEAGESAAIFDSKYPGSHPWHIVTNRSPLSLAVLAQRFKLGFLLTRRSADQEQYFRHILDSSFSRGYRKRRSAATKKLP